MSLWVFRPPSPVSVIPGICFPGARFTLTAVTSIGNAIRASWTFGPPERPDAVTGMDFVILDGDKISQLYAFVERPDD